MKKRKEKEGAEFVKNSFNTKWDFPHASGNSVDIAFVSIKTNEQVLCVKSIEDINERRKSWSTGYYQNSTDSQEQEIHQNRLLMKSMMQKYGFEWIPHEYWHFNFIWTN